jgi:autotransporter-associated beta strand protein
VGQAALAALSVILVAGGTARAVDRNKANDTNDLNLTTSWVGGVVPGAGDVGVWEATVVGANVANLGADLSWGGVRIANPGGAVTIGGANVLTLGGSGINMGAATQNLTIASGLTLAADTKQTWTVGAGRTLTVSGALTQSPGGAVAFDTTAGGTINVSSGTPTSILRYGVVNGTDVAALDATNNVVGVGAVLTYNQNPNTAGALPNIAGTQNGFDVVNLNTNGTEAFRLSNNLTINAFNTAGSTGVIRFNTEWNDAVNPIRDWTVDVAQQRTITWTDNNPVLIMTAGTGASNVVFDGGGHIRANGSGTFWLHQSNPTSSMIFNNGLGFSQSGGAQQLHKDGVGRVIINSDASTYTGATHIVEGTLQIGNGGTLGNLNAASAIINNARWPLAATMRSPSPTTSPARARSRSTTSGPAK